jgi:hypothetical protein
MNMAIKPAWVVKATATNDGYFVYDGDVYPSEQEMMLESERWVKRNRYLYHKGTGKDKSDPRTGDVHLTLSTSKRPGELAAILLVKHLNRG